MRDKNGFCIPAGVNEPGELVSKIRDDTQLSNYTDSTAASKKVYKDHKAFIIYQLTFTKVKCF